MYFCLKHGLANTGSCVQGRERGVKVPVLCLSVLDPGSALGSWCWWGQAWDRLPAVARLGQKPECSFTGSPSAPSACLTCIWFFLVCCCPFLSNVMSPSVPKEPSENTHRQVYNYRAHLCCHARPRAAPSSAPGPR